MMVTLEPMPGVASPLSPSSVSGLFARVNPVDQPCHSPGRPNANGNVEICRNDPYFCLAITFRPDTFRDTRVHCSKPKVRRVFADNEFDMSNSWSNVSKGNLHQSFGTIFSINLKKIMKGFDRPHLTSARTNIVDERALLIRRNQPGGNALCAVRQCVPGFRRATNTNFISPGGPHLNFDAFP